MISGVLQVTQENMRYMRINENLDLPVMRKAGSPGLHETDTLVVGGTGRNEVHVVLTFVRVQVEGGV